MWCDNIKMKEIHPNCNKLNHHVTPPNLNLNAVFFTSIVPDFLSIVVFHSKIATQSGDGIRKV